jgi:hypothetical protein
VGSGDHRTSSAIVRRGTDWALEWLRRIRRVYHLNRERLQHPFDSVNFQEQNALLRYTLETMRVEAVTELSDPQLRHPHHPPTHPNVGHHRLPPLRGGLFPGKTLR